REAITNVNTSSDTTNGDCSVGNSPDTIAFSVSGTITLNSNLPFSDAADLTIDGIDQSVTINGNSHQVFSLNGAGVTYRLNQLTLMNGNSPIGGAIYNVGTLNVTDCIFSGNQAINSGYGGAIYNRGDGTVNITNSTFINNGASAGGAIYNEFGST